MEVKLSRLADEEYRVVNESGNEVLIDMYEPSNKKAQSPMQLLLSAVGACGAVDLVHMIKKRRKTLLDLKAVVTGERRDEIPKSFTSIHIKYIIHSPDLTEQEASKLVKLAVEDYCSVRATLSGKAAISHSYVIIRD